MAASSSIYFAEITAQVRRMCEEWLADTATCHVLMQAEGPPQSLGPAAQRHLMVCEYSGYFLQISQILGSFLWNSGEALAVGT